MLRLSPEIRNHIITYAKENKTPEQIKDLLKIDNYSARQIKSMIEYQLKKEEDPDWLVKNKQKIPKKRREPKPQISIPAAQEVQPQVQTIIKEPDKTREGKMEKAELDALMKEVKNVVTQTLADIRNQENQTQEEKNKQKKLEETLTSINSLAEKVNAHEIKLTEAEKQIKPLCDQFPGMCSTLEELKKAKPKDPAKTEESIMDTEHRTLEELLSCPSCLLGHIKKVGFDKAAAEICNDDDGCKNIISELVKKGYKVEAPQTTAPAVEKEKKGSHFNLGKSKE